MKRREFVGLAATGIIAPAFAPGVARASHPDVAGLRTRKGGKVEIVYKSPHAKPNGLQATRQGLWVQDQGPENWVSLVNWADGKVIREFKPDIQAASGVTVDDNDVMWVSSTYSCMHVAYSPLDGKTIAKYWTPGAGRIYQMAGNPPASRTTLKPAYRKVRAPRLRLPGVAVRLPDRRHQLPTVAETPVPAGLVPAGLSYGQLPLDAKSGLGGTGAHGIEHRGGLLYLRFRPPARFTS